MPTSLLLSCQSQVLENSQPPPACACVCEGKWEGDNLCMRKCVWSHNAAVELNREHSQLSDVSFSNCCRTGKVETCPYTWYSMTTWAVGSSSWIAPLKIRMSVTLWVYWFGCVWVWGVSAGADYISLLREPQEAYFESLCEFQGSRTAKWMCYQ